MIMASFAERATKAEAGKTYPAWRDGHKPGPHGHVLHAVTDKPAGVPMQSGFLALCGRSVRYPVEPVFDVDYDASCLACSVAILVAEAEA